MRYLLAGFLALVVACVATTGGGGNNAPITQNPRPRPVAADPDHGHDGHHDPMTPKREPKAAGMQCMAGAECESGICEGQGCGDTPGTCAPAARGCTRDRRDYCGCDGKTFQASGSCPGQRFSAREACPAS